MTQAQPKLLTLEEFSNWYPDGLGRYELRQGAVLEMQPTGTHEQVAGFLAQKLAVEIDRLALPYLIPRQAIVKAIDSEQSGYNPDVIVLKPAALETEPLWKKRSTITRGESVALVIEVTSTNWQDDYLTKLKDYEALGIPEYWIVDYLGLGGRRYIGFPKQPTLSVYQLMDSEYEITQFRQQDSVLSPTFPELQLTVAHILKFSQ